MRRVVHAIAFGRDPSPRQTHAKAATALQKTHAAWWDQRNVVGLCFAPKVTHGRVDGIALQIHVVKKRHHSKIPRERRVPEFIRVPGVRGKVWTDVRELGRPHLDVLVSPNRPTHPGFNIGNRAGGSGTLTCVVRSRANGELLGLSCGHVIARYGQAHPGERVLVPSFREAQVNGWLPVASFGGLVAIGAISCVYTNASKNVDAATVRPDDPATLSPTIALLGVGPNGIRPSVSIGTKVHKVGYATELTAGIVQVVHWVTSLPFPMANGTVRSVWFSDQVGISSFASQGDSGALVLDEANAAVGVHVGSFSGLSICAPIQHVLDGVGCDLA